MKETLACVCVLLCVRVCVCVCERGGISQGAKITEINNLDGDLPVLHNFSGKVP